MTLGESSKRQKKRLDGVTHSPLLPRLAKAAGDGLWITPHRLRKRTSAAPLLFQNVSPLTEQKSGQVMCYKTGQVYLLLTVPLFSLTDSDAFSILHLSVCGFASHPRKNMEEIPRPVAENLRSSYGKIISFLLAPAAGCRGVRAGGFKEEQ